MTVPNYIVVIGFSTPRAWKPFASLIKLYQRTNYSHTYIRFYDTQSGKFLIAEAGHGEVHLQTLKNWRKKNAMVCESTYEISPEAFRKMRNFILDQLQVKYSIVQNLGIVLHDLFGVKLFTNGVEGFNCSELVARALPELFKGITKPIDFVKPSEIHALIYGKK